MLCLNKASRKPMGQGTIQRHRQAKFSYQAIYFYVYGCRSPLLSDSDCPFGIFKLF